MLEDLQRIPKHEASEKSTETHQPKESIFTNFVSTMLDPHSYTSAKGRGCTRGFHLSFQCAATNFGTFSPISPNLISEHPVIESATRLAPELRRSLFKLFG